MQSVLEAWSWYCTGRWQSSVLYTMPAFFLQFQIYILSLFLCNSNLQIKYTCTSINCSYHLHCEWVSVDWCCWQELFAEMWAQSFISLICQNIGFIRPCSSSAKLVSSLCCMLYFCISPAVQLFGLLEVARTFLQHLLLCATTSLCIDAHAVAFEPHLAVHPVLLAKAFLWLDLP